MTRSRPSPPVASPKAPPPPAARECAHSLGAEILGPGGGADDRGPAGRRGPPDDHAAGPGGPGTAPARWLRVESPAGGIGAGEWARHAHPDPRCHLLWAAGAARRDRGALDRRPPRRGAWKGARSVIDPMPKGQGLENPDL